MSDSDNRERLQNYQDLIDSRQSLLDLTQKDEWKEVVKDLEGLRVAAMYASIAEGDTTDAKAYARALDNIIAQMKGYQNSTELDTLKSQFDSLKTQVRDQEAPEYSPYSTGLV